MCEGEGGLSEGEEYVLGERVFVKEEVCEGGGCVWDEGVCEGGGCVREECVCVREEGV